MSILFFIILSGCSSQNKKYKDELEKSKENTTKYSNLVNISDEKALKLSDNELVDLASKLFANVGGEVHFKEDSLKLLKALYFLDVALSKNPNNEAAYHNKINLHISFKDYNKAISAINSLIEIKGEYPESLMYKGVLYEIIEIKENPGNNFVKVIKTQVIENFDREKFIKKSI